MRRMSYDRKAFSAEPSAQYGKRWEDLIDAATSATEDVNDDRTPVCAIITSDGLQEVAKTLLALAPLDCRSYQTEIWFLHGNNN